MFKISKMLYYVELKSNSKQKYKLTNSKNQILYSNCYALFVLKEQLEHNSNFEM